MEREKWFGCYESGWEGLIVPEAFSHPARYSRGLIYRIIKTGIERGYWRAGDTILDPFGGVGIGGLACAASGLQWLGVELEQEFVRMADRYDGCPGVTAEDWASLTLREPYCPYCKACLRDKERRRQPKFEPHHYVGNIEKHEAMWRLLNLPVPRIIQGDSRNLAEILAGVGISGSVTSPPYIEGLGHGRSYRDAEKRDAAMSRDIIKGKAIMPDVYGPTPGQLGAMSEGRLGGITSPPFSQPETRDRHPVQDGSVADAMTRAHTVDRQAQTDGNIAAMSGITSPPFADSKPGSGDFIAQAKRLGSQYREEKIPYEKRGFLDPGYNENAQTRNLGTFRNLTDTYWGACRLVYQQLYDLFSPGSVLCVVLKPFVRSKRIVDLPQMTLDLLLSQGWQPVAWIDAMLVSEAEQLSAMPDIVPHKRKKRVSFFRRLYERKFPGNEIDSEVVLVVKRV